jgi:hypothetical protein
MTLSIIYITLKKTRLGWELVAPSGAVLTEFREKYNHKALERARAWASTWSNWVVRVDDGIRMPTETYRKD